MSDRLRTMEFLPVSQRGLGLSYLFRVGLAVKFFGAQAEHLYGAIKRMEAMEGRLPEGIEYSRLGDQLTLRLLAQNTGGRLIFLTPARLVLPEAGFYEATTKIGKHRARPEVFCSRPDQSQKRELPLSQLQQLSLAEERESYSCRCIVTDGTDLLIRFQPHPGEELIAKIEFRRQKSTVAARLEMVKSVQKSRPVNGVFRTSVVALVEPRRLEEMRGFNRRLDETERLALSRRY